MVVALVEPLEAQPQVAVQLGLVQVVTVVLQLVKAQVEQQLGELREEVLVTQP